jgi:hypothetical protein
MRNFLTLSGVLVCAALSAAQPRGIDRLSWLQGCWESVQRDGVVEEQWTAPRGGNMIGVSRTISGDRLVAYELTVVREQGEQLAYEAHPSGQKSAVFLSRSMTESSVLFENSDHDFPQRIGYRRDGPNLLAWIEGTQNGAMRRIELPYRPTACAGR